MYQTSNEFNLAIKNSIIHYNVRGIINGTSFSQSDVLKGSLSLSNKCSNNNEINIGSVYIGELSIVLLLELDHYELIDKQISLDCGVLISANTYEWIPMGVFNIAEATKTQNGLSIKAYDNMSKLDKEISEQVNGTAFEIATFACAQCGLVLANADFDNFVNPQRLVEYPDTDIETYRDLLFWVSQAIGCFVTANRLGQIEFRTYSMDAVDTLGTNNRFSNGNFADYETWYTSLTAENMDDDSISTYQNQVNDGLCYDLGANPFLQFNDKDSARENVLSVISSFKYVPFSISAAANPAYDLGDVLSLPGGMGDANKKFCVTSFTWKYNNNVSVSGGGKNPKLLSVKSALEKKLNGMKKRQSDKDVIQYYSFTNTIDLLIEDGQSVTIVDINYAALKKSQAIFNAEILFNVETTTNEEGAVLPFIYNDAVAEFYYYFDEVLLNRVPAETWQDGKHMAHLLYYLITDPGIIHHLEIKCKMVGGSALISMTGVKACLYGQNLVASDDWGGIKNIKEDVSSFALNEIAVANAVDQCVVSITAPQTEEFSENISSFALSEISIHNVADSVFTILDRTSKSILTETGELIITETGDVIYTEGD